MDKKNKQSRRDFLSTATLGAIGTIGATSLLSSCASTASLQGLREESQLSLSKPALDGVPLRAVLVCCVGRSTWAAFNFVVAGPYLDIVALGDVFEDQVEKCRTGLK